MKWKREGELYSAYGGRLAIRKDYALVFASSRPRKVVNWVLMQDGADLEGYSMGEDTLADAKRRLEKLAPELLVQVPSAGLAEAS